MNPSEPRNAALKAAPRLDAYFSDEDERRRVTRAMFDQAAAGYDEAERLTGFSSGPWYRHEVLRRRHGTLARRCVARSRFLDAGKDLAPARRYLLGARTAARTR